MAFESTNDQNPMERIVDVEEIIPMDQIRPPFESTGAQHQQPMPQSAASDQNLPTVFSQPAQPEQSTSDTWFRSASFNQAFNVQESLKRPPGKSILKKTIPSASGAPTRRISSLADITTYNQLMGKVENLDQMLTTDDGLIDTNSIAHKNVAQKLARNVQEAAPRYAIRLLYNEFLPCLKKINQHYHEIALGASAEHPDLRDCDTRLAWATEYVKKTNDLI